MNHEHITAPFASGGALGLMVAPPSGDVTEWLLRLGTAVLSGVLTTAVWHLAKWLVKQAKPK